MNELEEINKHFEKIQNERNNRGISDFEGYSPIEMQFVIYDTFGNDSPIQLLELCDTDFKKIPLLNQIKYLLKLVNDNGELKLTAKGFLPPKIVSDIYNQKYIKEEMIESGISKLYKETGSNSINLTRILLELSELIKKRNNKLTLTKKGKAELNENLKLLKSILKAFGTKFNWGYYDGYRDNEIGQLGFGFSLILLGKYGSERRHDLFYAKKYLSAFPMLIEQVETSRFNTKEEQVYKCYSLRTFDRFLNYFGLVEIDSKNKLNSDKFIKKTELFDKLIKIRPHNKQYKKLGRK